MNDKAVLLRKIQKLLEKAPIEKLECIYQFIKNILK